MPACALMALEIGRVYWHFPPLRFGNASPKEPFVFFGTYFLASAFDFDEGEIWKDFRQRHTTDSLRRIFGAACKPKINKHFLLVAPFIAQAGTRPSKSKQNKANPFQYVVRLIFLIFGVSGRGCDAGVAHFCYFFCEEKVGHAGKRHKATWFCRNSELRL